MNRQCSATVVDRSSETSRTCQPLENITKPLKNIMSNVTFLNLFCNAERLVGVSEAVSMKGARELSKSAYQIRAPNRLRFWHISEQALLRGMANSYKYANSPQPLLYPD
eukprot:5657512-Pyramimonas_sp.AAC.2